MSIFVYHSIQADWDSPLAVSPDDFAKHCEWLSRSRAVQDLSLTTSVLDSSSRVPRGLASITFDDGFRSVFQHASPILRQFGLPATIFVVAETLSEGGKPVDWLDDPPQVPVETLTREEILEMQDQGMSFQSHSYSHLDLTDMSDSECSRDLSSSRELLEDVLGRRVLFLAYPRGTTNARVQRAAERAGYTHAFATKPRRHSKASRYAISRVGVYANDSMLTLRLKGSRAYIPIRGLLP